MPACVVLLLQALEYRGSRYVNCMVSDSKSLTDDGVLQGVHLILAIIGMLYHQVKQRLTLRLRDTPGTWFPRSEIAESL